MRILVTGGAGFIGSHLCDALVAEGHAVIAVDNLITGREENVAHLASAQGFTFLYQDVIEPLAIDGPLDWVLHLASPASPIDYLNHPLETMRVGAHGTEQALELAKQKGARFLLSSTSEVYGDPLVHPQSEGYWGNVNPVGPRSVYDEAKRYAEALTMAYHRHHGVSTRIVRIFNTYGPRNRVDDGRVVPTFINHALRGEPLTIFGDGSQTRSFQYVSDLVRGLRKLMEVETPDPVNIGNPVELTITQFAELVVRLAGQDPGVVHLPLPQDDPKLRKPDITRAREVLGWQPEVAVEDGIARTIAWYRQHTMEPV